MSAVDYPIDPRDARRRQGPIGRRKIGQDMWPDEHRNPGPSMMDRLQEPDSRAYAHNRRSGEWMPEAQGRRMHETVGWEKQSPRRRGPEWGEDYPTTEWRDRPREWESAMADPQADWHPRRYQNTWKEGDRGEWSGNVRKRIGVKSPTAPPARQTTSIRREASLPVADQTVEVPVTEDAAFTKPETKSFSPMSPSKQQPDEGKVSPLKEEKAEPTSPPADLPVIEKDNFSDFSDDSDDILNQEPVAVPAEKLEMMEVDDGKITQGDIASYDEIMEEERMDLEEISDDDFEEEKQVKYSVANALDIDWSTLKVDPNTQPVDTQTSALKRFSTLNILSRLGVSSKYASKEFLDDLVDKCYRMEIDRISNKTTAQTAADQPADGNLKPKNEPMEPDVQQENYDETESQNETETDNAKNGIADNAESVTDDLPQILPVVVDDGVLKHVRQAKLNRSRIFYLGRKALCSTDDIIIRRRLCNLPDDDILFEKPQFNKALFQTTLSLLKT